MGHPEKKKRKITGTYTQNEFEAFLKTAGFPGKLQKASTEQHIKGAVAFNYYEDTQRAIQGTQGSMLGSGWWRKSLIQPEKTLIRVG